MKFFPRSAFLIFFATTNLFAATPISDDCKIGGFALGCQSYSFNDVSAFEAIDKIAATGAKTVEFFSWQKFSPEHPNLEVNSSLPDKYIAELKAKLKSAGLRATSMYFG